MKAYKPKINIHTYTNGHTQCWVIVNGVFWLFNSCSDLNKREHKDFKQEKNTFENVR